MKLYFCSFIASAALLTSACEEVPPPTATQVCLPMTSAEEPDLCSPQLCVERVTELASDTTTGRGLALQAACPTPEILARDGLPLSAYRLPYSWQGPTFDVGLTLTFSGELCARPFTLDALRETLLSVSGSAYIPTNAGRSGYAGFSEGDATVEFVALAGGRIHVRARGTLTEVVRGTDELLCVNSAGHVPSLSSCMCAYGDADLTLAFDLNVPVAAPTQP